MSAEASASAKVAASAAGWASLAGAFVSRPFSSAPPDSPAGLALLAGAFASRPFSSALPASSLFVPLWPTWGVSAGAGSSSSKVTTALPLPVSGCTGSPPLTRMRPRPWARCSLCSREPKKELVFSLDWISSVSPVGLIPNIPFDTISVSFT